MNLLLKLSLPLVVLVATGMLHPHLKRTETLELENVGKIEVSHITVPFNPKHLEALDVGFLYHLGFASLKLPCELKSGDLTVPAGEYTLAARYAGDGKWVLALFASGLSRDVASLSFALMDSKESTRSQARKQLEDHAKKLNVSAQPIELATVTSENEQVVEHLAIHIQVADAKGSVAEGFSLWTEFGPMKAVAHLGLKTAGKSD